MIRTTTKICVDPFGKGGYLRASSCARVPRLQAGEQRGCVGRSGDRTCYKTALL